MAKEKQIAFRISNKDYEFYKKLADDYGITISDYVQRAAELYPVSASIQEALSKDKEFLKKRLEESELIIKGLLTKYEKLVEYLENQKKNS